MMKNETKKHYINNKIHSKKKVQATLTEIFELGIRHINIANTTPDSKTCILVICKHAIRKLASCEYTPTARC